MEVQTRSEETGLGFYNSIAEAFEAAEKDRTIWKISFTVNGEHVRLVKVITPTGEHTEKYSWIYRPII